MADFIFHKPPLIEVIAELRWPLQQLTIMPNAGIDPLFSGLSAAIRAPLAGLGFGAEERVVPEHVPIELLANQPILRFRKSDGAWPLVQLGPGVLTVNITPPYDGWPVFRALLSDVTKTMFSVINEIRPGPFSFGKLDLRYIDGFGPTNNFETYPSFCSKYLRLNTNVPDELRVHMAGGTAQVSSTLALEFPCLQPTESTGRIAVSPGLLGVTPAAIMEFLCSTSSQNAGSSAGTVEDWFDQAHSQLSSWFFAVTTSELQATFGEKLPVPA